MPNSSPGIYGGMHAHKLKNPLPPAQNALEIWKREAAPPDEIHWIHDAPTVRIPIANNPQKSAPWNPARKSDLNSLAFSIN